MDGKTILTNVVFVVFLLFCVGVISYYIMYGYMSLIRYLKNKTHKKLVNKVIKEMVRRGLPYPIYVDHLDNDRLGEIITYKDKSTNKVIMDLSYVNILESRRDDLLVHAHELGHLIGMQDHNDDLSEETAYYEGFRFCYMNMNFIERKLISEYMILNFYCNTSDYMKSELENEFNLDIFMIIKCVNEHLEKLEGGID